METKTVNCPECHSPNFYSVNDDLIRCRACGANIHIRQITEKDPEPEPEAAEPIIRIPEANTPPNTLASLVQASMADRFATYLADQFFTALVLILLSTSGGGYRPDMTLFMVLIAIVAYYTLLEGSNGKTIGKLMAGTRVVNEDGSPLTYGTAFFRTLCRMIPFEVFSIFFHNGRCWHDLITRTYVIKDR